MAVTIKVALEFKVSGTALEDAMAGDRQLVVAAQRVAGEEDPTPEDIFAIGTLGTIIAGVPPPWTGRRGRMWMDRRVRRVVPQFLMVLLHVELPF